MLNPLAAALCLQEHLLLDREKRMRNKFGTRVVAPFLCTFLLVLGIGFRHIIVAPLHAETNKNSGMGVPQIIAAPLHAEPSTNNAGVMFSCDGWTGDDSEHQNHFWTDKKISYSNEEHGVKLIGNVGKSAYFVLYAPNDKVPERSKLMVGRRDSDGFEARTVSYVTNPVLLSVNRVGEERQVVACSATGQIF
jgi:hypothetical protein